MLKRTQSVGSGRTRVLQVLARQSSVSLSLNAFYNLLGAGLPILAALWAIPLLIDNLGNAFFGVLTLVWALIGYFSIFDLGIGRATTKYVAEYTSRNKTAVLSQLVTVALGLLLTMGGLLALIAGFGATALTSTLEGLEGGDAATTSLQLAALSLPAVMASSAARGVLEGQGKFLLMNLIKIPTGIGMFVVPAAVSFLGFGLEGVVVSLILVRLISFTAYAVSAARAIPLKIPSPRLARMYAIRLVSYGGWILLGIAAGSLMALAYVDKFIIASVLSVEELTYYATPFEIIFRLLFIPGAIVAVLFSVMSSLGRDGHWDGAYKKTNKLLLLLVMPVVIVGITFGDEILALWLNESFSERSGIILQLATVGFLFNSLAHVPNTALQAFGAHKASALRHVVELPIYLVALVAAIKLAGIHGAAVVWAMWAFLDLKFLQWLMKRAGLPQPGMRNCELTLIAFICLAAFMNTQPLLGKLVFVTLSAVGIATFVAVRNAKRPGWLNRIANITC